MLVVESSAAIVFFARNTALILQHSGDSPSHCQFRYLASEFDSQSEKLGVKNQVRKPRFRNTDESHWEQQQPRRSPVSD